MLTLHARRYIDLAEHLGSSSELVEVEKGGRPLGVIELRGKKLTLPVDR